MSTYTPYTIPETALGDLSEPSTEAERADMAKVRNWTADEPESIDVLREHELYVRDVRRSQAASNRDMAREDRRMTERLAERTMAELETLAGPPSCHLEAVARINYPATWEGELAHQNARSFAAIADALGELNKTVSVELPDLVNVIEQRR